MYSVIKQIGSLRVFGLLVSFTLQMFRPVAQVIFMTPNDRCSHRTPIHSRFGAAGFWSVRTRTGVITKCEQAFRKASLTIHLAESFTHKHVNWLRLCTFFFFFMYLCKRKKVAGESFYCEEKRQAGSFLLFAEKKKKKDREREEKHKTYIPGSFHVRPVRLEKHCTSSACHQGTFIISRKHREKRKKKRREEKTPQLEAKTDSQKHQGIKLKATQTFAFFLL